MTTDISSKLPKLLLGDELRLALTRLPHHDRAAIESMSASERLLKLTDIYKVFIPSSMTFEIYQKLYMMVSMSLQQKGSIDSIRQRNATYKWAHGGEFQGVITGATSSTVIGSSGIGKTSAIQYASKLLGPVIECDDNIHRIIPVLMVSCPFDCSYKGLLCQILISIDEILETHYYERSEKSKMNSQQILGMVCQLCHLYVGTLIIDEIQFIVDSKSGKLLYQMILQLINTSCISVLLVGTNECLDFFTQAPQIARRTVGLEYGPMEFGDEFRNLCNTLFTYQYVVNEAPLSEPLIYWLYEHTGGISASLVSLIHDAQEIAILKGQETLGIETLTEAYSSRMKMLHGHTAGYFLSRKKAPQQIRLKESFPAFRESEAIGTDISIASVVADAKKAQKDIIGCLKEHFYIEEIAC